MLEFAAHMEKAHGYQTRQLDLGGGYGVRYVECDPVLDVDAKVAQVAAAAKGACARLGIALPEIHMEPGRSIVGDEMCIRDSAWTVSACYRRNRYLSKSAQYFIALAAAYFRPECATQEKELPQ